MAKPKKPEIIEINKDNLNALMEKLEADTLLKSDYPELKSYLAALGYLTVLLEEKGLSIRRLKKAFSIKTEKSKQILKAASEVDSTSAYETGRVDGTDRVAEEEVVGEVTGETSGLEKGTESGTTSPKKKGHGRNGASAYTGLPRIKLQNENLKEHDACPLCPKGTLYKMNKSLTTVLITGNAPLQGIVYERERLRCSSCLEIFKPELPKGISTTKYDEEARAIVSLLKYGTGMPFYRLESFQKSLGVPMPSSNQWELVEYVGSTARSIYLAMIYKAAEAELFYHDDTWIKILDFLDEKKHDKIVGIENNDETLDTDIGFGEQVLLSKQESESAAGLEPARKRKGMFTTGVVAKIGNREIVLYFSGRQHSGENMEFLLRKRPPALGPPLRMCDAEPRNTPKGFESTTINCLVHGRRNFVDLVDVFPTESRFVIETLARVYRHDRTTQAIEMSGRERLEYHQRKSGPVMAKLKKWLDDQLDERKVEPNSSLGRAIKYMLKHWEKLTAFLRIENAPLDNNMAERILKNAILNRKNSYFYRTVKGAKIGDILMSIIQTCNRSTVNPFEYLVAIQKYAESVIENPTQWFPWNYLRTLEKQKSPFP